jgi:6-phospho-3-hexuloisomerase
MFATALDELGAVLARTDEARIDAACELLAGAGKIAVYGCGREALQV